MNDPYSDSIIVSPTASVAGPPTRAGSATAPRSRADGWSGRMGWEALVPSKFRGPGTFRATPQTSLGLSAYFACVNVISTDIASLPFKVYRRRKGGGRDEVRDDVRYELLDLSPDDETTSQRSRQSLMGHVLGWGNGFWEVEMTNGLRPKKLHLLDPRTQPVRNEEMELEYRTPKGEIIPKSRVCHFAGLGFDGLVGYTVAKLLADAIELGVSAQEASLSFFRKGLRPSGVVELPYTLEDEEAVKRFLATIQAGKTGAGEFGSVLLLEGGAKFNKMSIDPRDAQFLETRQFQILEIARLFRVPPHLIMDNSQVQLASAGVEAMNLMYMTTTLMPWCRMIEKVVNLRLFTRKERADGLYAEHDMRAFMRGDAKSRAEYHRQMRDLGAETPAMICEAENLNPPDEFGDERVRPANLVPLGYVPQKKVLPTAPADKPEQQGETNARDAHRLNGVAAH